MKNRSARALSAAETGPVAVNADGTFALPIILVHGMVNGYFFFKQDPSGGKRNV